MNRIPCPAITALLVGLVIVACSPADGSQSEPVATSTKQIAIAIDLSGSQSDSDRDRAYGVVEKAIASLYNGDMIVLWQIHQRSVKEDTWAPWIDTIPHLRRDKETALDREAVERTQSATLLIAKEILLDSTAGTLPHTDLFSTMKVAAEFKRDSGPRRSILLVLSDMLQSANGVEMSRRNGIPGSEWIHDQARRGLLPNLDGICVVVIGADATTEHGLAVRAFWMEYFEMSGADLRNENYRLFSVADPISGCL